MAMLDPHPALKAVSPQASPPRCSSATTSTTTARSRLNYGFEYVAMMEGGKEITLFDFDQYDIVQLVPVVRLAQDDHRQPAAGQVPDVEELRRAPELRRVLAA
jgi:hypothetical protein